MVEARAECVRLKIWKIVTIPSSNAIRVVRDEPKVPRISHTTGHNGALFCSSFFIAFSVRVEAIRNCLGFSQACDLRTG